MSRYIDADKLIGMIEAKADTLIQGKEAFQYIAKWIELLPKADVVEVVRCKECKHYNGEFCGEIYYIMDGYYNGGFEIKKPNDFCSYGERKGQEE